MTLYGDHSWKSELGESRLANSEGGSKIYTSFASLVKCDRQAATDSPRAVVRRARGWFGGRAGGEKEPVKGTKKHHTRKAQSSIRRQTQQKHRGKRRVMGVDSGVMCIYSRRLGASPSRLAASAVTGVVTTRAYLISIATGTGQLKTVAQPQ